MKPEISIILPTKEEEAIFEVVAEFKKIFGKSAEIIIVDKSSGEYKGRLKKLNVTVLAQKDKGVENALIEGMAHAHANIIATIDADATHELSGIKEGMKLIKQNRADLVLGNRMGNLDPGSMSAYLKLGNHSLSLIYNLFYHTHIHDILTGMQVMRKKVFEDVKDIRAFKLQIAFFQTEAARLGYRVEEVPIKYHIRKYGESKLTNSKLFYGFQTAWRLVKRSPYYNGFLVCGAAGALLSIIGLVFAADGRGVIWLALVVLGVLIGRLGLEMRI